MISSRKRLKELREQRKLKQHEVAAALGMSTCYYGMIERGERNPILEDAKKLSDFFGETIEALFFEELSYNPYSNPTTLAPTGTE